MSKSYFEYQTYNELQLARLLVHNVPRFIQHIKNKGGVSDEELQWLQCEDDIPDYPAGLMMRADEYLLYPLSEAHFQKGLFVLTLTLAIMSFFPSGVKSFSRPSPLFSKPAYTR